MEYPLCVVMTCCCFIEEFGVDRDEPFLCELKVRIIQFELIVPHFYIIFVELCMLFQKGDFFRNKSMFCLNFAVTFSHDLHLARA